ncbi:hypothetical protein J6590_041134 [Homalodisca vitripennis]|nr:hypothetical protein J6590_041134 [Homalodisca vitripennis]
MEIEKIPYLESEEIPWQMTSWNGRRYLKKRIECRWSTRIPSHFFVTLKTLKLRAQRNIPLEVIFIKHACGVTYTNCSGKTQSESSGQSRKKEMLRF